MVEAYAGPTNGVQPIKASEWVGPEVLSLARENIHFLNLLGVELRQWACVASTLDSPVVLLRGIFSQRVSETKQVADRRTLLRQFPDMEAKPTHRRCRLDFGVFLFALRYLRTSRAPRLVDVCSASNIFVRVVLQGSRSSCGVAYARQLHRTVLRLVVAQPI